MQNSQNTNNRIEIYSGSLEVTQLDNYIESGEGKVFLALSPEPKIEFELYTPKITPPIDYGEASLKLIEFNLCVHSYITELPKDEGQTDDSMWIGGTVWQPINIETGKDIRIVKFRLINFHARSDFRMEAEGWRITIRPLKNFSDTINHLKLTKGFAITHTGTLERIDGNTFSPQEADDIMEVLFFFLSFARGAWVSPILPVGFDDAEGEIWKFWYPCKVENWQPLSSWFIEIMPHMADFVFSGFLKKWQNPIWHDPLRLVLDWYAQSNTQNTETSIILNQASFELLSWVLLVEDKAIISREGFDKLLASDKLRLLLSQAGIPLKIDSRQVSLTKLGQDFKWQDGPQALTEMRNRMVHPKTTDLKVSNQPKSIKNILVRFPTRNYAII